MSDDVLTCTGDEYDAGDQPYQSRQNRLEDIKDWNSGSKSIAEEALDKVKEIFSGIKWFDSQDEYNG